MGNLKRNFLLGLVVFLMVGTARVFACSCVDVSDPEMTIFTRIAYAMNGATAVFSGKVVGFENRKGMPSEFEHLANGRAGLAIEGETQMVKFQVDRWWKLAVPEMIFLASDVVTMPDGSTMGNSCHFDFKQGESYLMYANGTENLLRPSLCSRSTIIDRASEDLKILGKGNEPIKKDEKP